MIWNGKAVNRSSKRNPGTKPLWFGISPLVIHTIPSVVSSRGILKVVQATSLIEEIDDKKSGGP